MMPWPAALKTLLLHFTLSTYSRDHSFRESLSKSKTFFLLQAQHSPGSSGLAFF